MTMTDDPNSPDAPAPDDAGGGRDSVVDRPELQAISGLSGLQRDVLLAIADLAGTEPSGSDVQSHLQDCFETDVSHGSLYRNLRDLHDDGYVTKIPLDGRTYCYRLTDVARTRLVSYLSWGIDCLDNDRQTAGEDPTSDGGRRDSPPLDPAEDDAFPPSGDPSDPDDGSRSTDRDHLREGELRDPPVVEDVVVGGRGFDGPEVTNGGLDE